MYGEGTTLLLHPKGMAFSHMSNKYNIMTRENYVLRIAWPITWLPTVGYTKRAHVTYTHSHTRTHTHTHTHTHTRTCTHTHTHARTHIHTQTRMHAFTFKYTHAHTQHAYTCTNHAHTRACTNMHPQTHTHTHTHTHTISPPSTFPIGIFIMFVHISFPWSICLRFKILNEFLQAYSRSHWEKKNNANNRYFVKPIYWHIRTL